MKENQSHCSSNSFALILSWSISLNACASSLRAPTELVPWSLLSWQTYKSSKGVDKGICVEGVRCFKVDSPRSHTSEQNTITLQLLPAIFNNKGTKIVDGAVGKGGAVSKRSSGRSDILCS